MRTSPSRRWPSGPLEEKDKSWEGENDEQM